MTEFDIDKSHYAYFNTINTRWIDNDVYGHVNNVVYYTWFDTVTNRYLIEVGGLDIQNSPSIGFIVSSACQYHSPVKFPDTIEAGLRVHRVGNASVEYGIGIFRQGDHKAAAHGTYTHVFVDRRTSKPTRIEGQMRDALLDIARRPAG